MKDKKNLEVYKLQEVDNNFCLKEEGIETGFLHYIEPTFEPIELSKGKSINKSCSRQKKYILLEHWTKILRDIRRYDDVENREKAEPMIKRYEQRRGKIKNARNKGR